MRGHRIIRMIGCLAMALSPVIGVSAVEGGDADGAIARAWLDRAIELMDSGGEEVDWEKVSEALSVSREFQRTGSDADYIEARILLSDHRREPSAEIRSSVKGAYDKLTDSLDGASAGDVVPFPEKAILWSSVALRLKEYGAIQDRFTAWPRGLRYDPVLMYAASRASLYLGLDVDAAEMARAGESLSDRTVDLTRLSPAFSGTAMLRFRALAVAAGDSPSIATLPAARKWGPGLDDALLPWVLSGHITSSSLMPLAGSEAARLAELLESGGRTDAGMTAPEQQLFRNDLALLRRLRRSGSDDMRRNIDALTASYTGTLVADADYDGYPEESVRMINGRPVERRIDTDQDGLFEWIIAYDGDPVQVVMDNGRTTVNFDGSLFPAVLSISRRDGGTALDVSFFPGSYEWNPFPSSGIWEPPRRPDRNERRMWEGVRKVSVVDSFDNEHSVGTAVTWLSDGYPLRARETRYRPGKADDPLWIRDILYEAGEPVAGRRSFRTDSADPNERLWELYERYEDGVLVGLAWDPGMTGSPLYLRDWALDRVLETQAWDLDRDEWIDARRFVMPDGRESSRELMVTEASSDDLLPWQPSDWGPWEY